MKNVFILFSLLVLSSCSHGEQPLIEGSFSEPASCPYISKTSSGEPVISYVALLNDSQSVMRYRISRDGGRSFGEAVTIAPSTNVHPHGENLPKVLFKPSGEIIAVWGESNSDPRNKYAGVVRYSQSFDKGSSWSDAKALVTDTNSFDQRYFDLALLPDGEAAIIWLDNREEKEATGSSLYFAKTSGNNGFMDEKVLDQTICPCCRTELFVDSKGGIHACYRDIINDSIRDMVHIYSGNGGRSFEPGKRISADNWVFAGCPHTGPAMTETRLGLHFSWYTGSDAGGVYYTSSDKKGRIFQRRDSVSRAPSAKHPQITATGENLVVVWDESYKAGENYLNRIGMQIRQKGDTRRLFLENRGEVCEFPVITSLPGEKVLIAYSSRTRDVSIIRWRRQYL